MDTKLYLIGQNLQYHSKKKQKLRELIKSINFDANCFIPDRTDYDALKVNLQVDRARHLKHSIITCFDACYPDELKALYDFPIVLYANGNLQRLADANKIAIVGTRKPTYDAKKMCDMAAKVLAKHSYTIISGLAFGTDALAHHAALAYGASTVAVLASPVDTISPKSNINLAKNILDSGGLILSETPYGSPTRNFMYVGRNRIVSGLASKVFIVEGAEGSGSMTTASHALDQNKALYAMPGSISNQVAIGTNRLIQQGAYPVITPEDLLSVTYDAVKLNTDAHPIIRCIDENGNLTIDALSQKMVIPVSTLLSELMILECEEKICIHENKVYINV